MGGGGLHLPVHRWVMKAASDMSRVGLQMAVDGGVKGLGVLRQACGGGVGWQREGKLSHSKFLGKESLSTLPVVSCAVLRGGIFLCPESERNA